MLALRNMIPHSRSPARHSLAKQGYSAGGLVLLVLALLGLYFLWPEIRRYIRIERM